MEKKKIKESIEKLLSLLTIDGAIDIEISEEAIQVVLDTKDMGIVIGYHGEILESLQLIASLVVSKKINRFVRVSIEVGDYKKNRTDYLTNLALKTKERVLEEQVEIPLSNLKSWERRIIHLVFQDDKDVASESQGEGRERVLVIKPR